MKNNSHWLATIEQGFEEKPRRKHFDQIIKLNKKPKMTFKKSKDEEVLKDEEVIQPKDQLILIENYWCIYILLVPICVHTALNCMMLL